MEQLEINYELFQQRLYSLIQSRSLNAREFAELIQVTPATISRYLNGARKPELIPILHIAKFCGVSVDWLLGLSGDKFDVFPPDVQEVAFSYSIATLDDKRVVDAVLSKYSKKD